MSSSMSDTVAIVAAQSDASFGDIVECAKSQKTKKHDQYFEHFGIDDNRSFAQPVG